MDILYESRVWHHRAARAPHPRHSAEDAPLVVARPKVHHLFSESVFRPDILPLRVEPRKTRSWGAPHPSSGMESEPGEGVTLRHWPSCSRDKTLLHAPTSDSRAGISGSSRRREGERWFPSRMSTPTCGASSDQEYEARKGRKRKTLPPLLLIHRHGNKISGDTGGTQTRLSASKNMFVLA